MKVKEYMYSTLLITILLGIWEVVARFVNQQFILPSPTGIVVKIWELKWVLLIHHLPPTLYVILIGLIISIILGVGLAIFMHMSEMAAKAFYPVIIASQTIPIIALAPIFVLWFGYSIWSKVAVTILFAFFPITVNTFDGFRSVSKEQHELLLTMGAKKKQIFMKLDVPSAMPHFFSGLKVAVPLSVIGAAIGEWLGAQAGLGYFSRRMMTQFDGAGIFAPIVLLSLLGMILFLFIIILEKSLLKWRRTK